MFDLLPFLLLAAMTNMLFYYRTLSGLAIFLLFRAILCGQEPALLLQMGRDSLDQGHFSAALRLGKAAIALLPNPGDSLGKARQIDAWDIAGRAFEKMVEFDSAEVYRKKALALTTVLYSENSLETAGYLNNFAGFYAGRACVQTAFDLRFRALGILENGRDTSGAAVRLLCAKVCNNLAALFEGKGETELALRYQEKALTRLDARADPSARCILPTHYAHLLARAGRMDEAREQLDRAAMLLTEEARPQAYFWNTRAELHRLSNRPDSALIYHYKRLEALNRYPLGPTDIAHTHLDVGYDFLQLRQWDSCMAHLDTAIRIETGIYGEKFSLNAVAWRLKAQCSREKGDTALAREYYLQSLRANNYEACSIPDLRDPYQGFLSFYALGELCLQAGNSVQALPYFFKADSALHIHRLQLQEPGSKIKLSADTRFLYEKAIDIAYRLWAETHDTAYAEQALYFAERHKGLLLQEAFLVSNARTLGGIPDSVFRPALRLRQDLAAHHQARWATIDRLAKQSGAKRAETHPDVLSISSGIAGIRFRLNALEAHLDTVYKLYGFLKSDNPPVSWRALRDSVLAPANKSLIEYFVAPNGVYAFSISPSGLSAHFQPIDRDSLREWVLQMRRGILGSHDERRPNPGAQPFLRFYFDNAHRLYRLLLPGAVVGEPGAPTLVIAPDDCLATIPFEALLTRHCENEKLFKNQPYLLRERIISYVPSATTLHLMGRVVRPDTLPLDLAGFAPFYEGPASALDTIFPGNRFMSEPYDRLDQSGRPLAAGRVAFPRHALYLYVAAAKQQLFQTARQCRILEIVTHALADTSGSDRACLIMRKKSGDAALNDSLFIGEIYSLDLKADLALILGCGTGQGKVQAGEGSISLTHAFAGAGARCVMATLWSVLESPAAQITADFFKAIKAGKRTDEALAGAKRKYLETANNSDALPYFWSGFYLFGDTNQRLATP